MLILSAALIATPALGQSDQSSTFEVIRQADLRLAAIGYRLSTGAAPLCDRIEAGTGIQFHTLAQFPPAVRGAAQGHFRFAGPVAVEGIVSGSPAEAAGVRTDDTVIEINGVASPKSTPTDATTGMLADLHTRFARFAPSAPIEMMLLREDRHVRVTIMPKPACYSRYELRIADSFDARANGELIQITSKSLERVNPAIVPAMVAHELAHNILRHRERLSAAGAEFGFASGFGRNVGLFRQTEIQADILAVHILARAGYSPQIAVRFWQEAGPKLLAGMVRSRSHPPLRDRIAIARAEAARFAATGPLPPPPAFFAARDQPLDGNWRQYLPPGER